MRQEKSTPLGILIMRKSLDDPVMPLLALEGRSFHLRQIATKETYKRDLDGSLLVMGGETQHHYKHQSQTAKMSNQELTLLLEKLLNRPVKNKKVNMIEHLTKNQSQYIFSLNGLCALLLFGKGLDGHETNLISLLPLIITLVTLNTLSTLTKKRQMSLFNILSFISLIVSYIFSAKLQYPQHFFQLIFLSIPFFLLYALRLFVSQTPKLKKLLILIFLIPIFFFYRNYWS